MNIPVTEWFPAEVKPVHVGQYQFKYQSGYTFPAFFDGSKFVIRDPKDVFYWDQSVIYKGEWRGLTSPHPEWKP